MAINTTITDSQIVNATVGDDPTINAQVVDNVINVTIEQWIEYDKFVETPPANYNSAGATGQWAVDDDYVYYCVSTNRWLRLAGSKNF